MVRRQKTPEAHDTPETSSETSAHEQEDRELPRLRKMLADARSVQETMKKASDIIFTRGLDRDGKEDQLLALGYTPSQAAEIMLDKQDVDQYGHAVVRPGFTRDQRGMAARNVRNLEAAVKRQEGRGHAGAEDARRSEGNAPEHDLPTH